MIRDSETMIRDMKVTANIRKSSRDQPESSATPPRVHLWALRGIPEVLEQLGVPSEPILRTVGLTYRDFEDFERTAAFADMDRLIGLCVARTKCQHFGLLVGRTMNLQSFGIAGQMARTATSVGAGLRDFATYFVLHDSGGAPSVAIHDGTVTLAYGVHALGVRNANQVYDLAVAAMASIMCQLCGPKWLPDAVLMPRKRPSELRPYREILRAPLRFDSAQAAMLFGERWLSHPVADADPLLHSLLEDRAASAMNQRDPMLHDDVRRAIRQLLLAGHCSRDAAARRIGLHARTLGRRLQASGATFQALLDDTRLQLARQLLHDTRSPVARIAGSLGYRDGTIFTRAFRRWTGLTPREFRASLSPDS